MVWVVGGISGLLYALYHSIPLPTAATLLTAFLIEIPLYLAPGFTAVRQQLQARLSRPGLALAMTATAAIPFLVYAVPNGVFAWGSLGALLLLAGLMSFWFVVLPKSRAADLLFFLFAAAVILFKVFRLIYPSPAPRVPMEVLGQLMWIRLGITAALVFRHPEGAGFGFLPSRREWQTGIEHFLYFLPIGVVLGLAIGFARFDPRPIAGWGFAATAAGTFLGMLWVVALSEEFFFRGLLQRWLSEWFRSQAAGLLLASALFGLVHLPFRSFPNWRFAVLAAVAGLFYGRAYLKAGGIRAAMVTHALVNTTWRMLFA